MVNDGQVNWPIDTCLELTDVFTNDLELTKVIQIGAEVPCNSQVKVKFMIGVKKTASEQKSRHEFSYQLCYGGQSDSDSHQPIGQAIKFLFKLPVAASSDSSILVESAPKQDASGEENGA